MKYSISKTTCKEYGISEQFANISFANLTADTLAYIILTGKVEKPSQSATSKGCWLDKLMSSKAYTWGNDEEGSFRKVFTYPDHNFIIKVEVRRTDRNNLNDPGTLVHFSQSQTEWETWNAASPALKSLLCPTLTCFVGKHGRQSVDAISGTATVGRYAISVMPYCDTEWRDYGFSVDNQRTLRAKLKAHGINDCHMNNVAVLNGNLVSIDYGIR